MIDTILAIGKAISQGRDPWEDVIKPPKADDKDGKFQLFQLGILFDLDEQVAVVDSEHLAEFDDEFVSLKQVGSLKVKGGNNKALYPCVDAMKIEQLTKTLFGKPGSDRGEMSEKLAATYPSILDAPLGLALTAIFPLRHSFNEALPPDAKGKYPIKSVSDQLGLGRSDKLVMVYALVKWEAKGIPLQPLAQLEGFDELVEKEFLKSEAEPAASSEQPDRLCYISGKMQADVQVADFSERYNINKIFVQTTQNYATQFDKKAYHKNYQASAALQTYLDRGSLHILEHFQTKIADLAHAVIPQVLSDEPGKIDFELLNSLKGKSDLLFRPQQLGSFLSVIEDEKPQLLWLNFVGIESDGNYFKINSLIKEVQHFHFIDIFKALGRAQAFFQPWLSNQFHNFGAMYGAIPIRKDQKQNPALQLFGAILEQRMISSRVLFQHFTELILCYRYGRYRAYANIYNPQKDDYFDFLAKDAVFKYLAFMYALRNLNQLTNDEPMSEETNVSPSIAEELTAFFRKLSFTPSQEALFFLGRAVNQIAFAQKGKGNKKRVLEKLNYNGMDAKSLFRLHNDLFEKGKQYDVVDKVTWDLGEFNRRFNLNQWNMNPQEALFYLLSGYTYRIRKQVTSPDEDTSPTQE
jgi:CRISPR-associated protein Csh1